MKKVIGLVHTRFSSKGGVESYINKLVPALIERQWEIHYFTAKVNQPVPPGMIVHKIPIVRGSSITRMLSFAYGAKRAVQKTKIPLVMGFGRTIYQDLYRDGSGCFLDYEKNSENKHFNRFYRKSYLHLEQKRFSDPRLKKIITVSKMVKNQILDRYDLPEKKVEVVYSGVDTKYLNPEIKTQKQCLRKKMGLPENAFIILLIGNGFKRKGVSYLIKAVKLLPSHLRCIALVAGQDKKAKQYRELAAQCGCEEQIYFLGHQENVAALYGAADLFVLPSLFDPLANVVLEALYSGTPVITGYQVGASELIDNGVNGFVVANYEPQTLSKAILTYYNTERKKEMAAKAHEVAKTYSWDCHMDKMENIFGEILTKKCSKN